MIVEFNHVRNSSREQYQKDIKREVSGEMSVTFENEEDYISKLYIEMDDVVDFVVGKCFWNEEELECVYVRLSSEEWTPNVLLSGEKFKRLLEKLRNIKIKSADEILNE